MAREARLYSSMFPFAFFISFKKTSHAPCFASASLCQNAYPAQTQGNPSHRRPQPLCQEAIHSVPPFSACAEGFDPTGGSSAMRSRDSTPSPLS